MKAVSVLIVWALPSLLLAFSCPHDGDYNADQAEGYICRCHEDGKKAECTYSEIGTIPNDLHPALYSLDVSYNRIRSISDLGGYSQLVNFRMTHNNLSSIKVGTFKDNSNMEVLDLSQNQLAEIKNGMLSGLTGLIDLNLAGNLINNIQDGSLADLESVTTLDLSNNVLTVLGDQLFMSGPSATLSSLNLAHNYLKNFPTEALSQLNQLSELNIGHNSLSRLENPVFKKLTLLTYLSLRENSLRSLGDSVFAGLETLETLDLSHNDLQEVPDRAFGKRSPIETLFLGGNEITTLGRSQLTGLPRLRSFSMEDCKGDSLVLEQEVFSSNTELRNLNLGRCGIREIESGVSLVYLNMLETVSLHANQIRTLHQDFLPTADLFSLDVSGCPLVCSCSLLWFRNLLQNNPQISRNASCLYDGEEARILLTEEEAFSCAEGLSVGWIVGIVLMALIVLLIIGVLVVVLMKRSGQGCSCADTGYAKITRFSLLPSTRNRRKKRNRLSANFTGKQDIEVLQNDIENNGRFIELPGLHQEQRLDDEQRQRQPIYEEVADAVQPDGDDDGGPGPDVKVSEL